MVYNSLPEIMPCSGDQFLVNDYISVVCNNLEQPLGDSRRLDSGEDVRARVPLHHEVGGLNLGTTVVYLNLDRKPRPSRMRARVLHNLPLLVTR